MPVAGYHEQNYLLSARSPARRAGGRKTGVDPAADEPAEAAARAPGGLRRTWRFEILRAAVRARRR